MTNELMKNNLKYFKKLIQRLNKENECLQDHSDTLSKMYDEVIKLKNARTMNTLPPKTLLDVCENLSYIISIDATQITSQKIYRKQVFVSSMASFIILQILTSAIDQSVYSEDVIDKITTFILQQFINNCRGVSNDSGIENNNTIKNMVLMINLLTELVTMHKLLDVQIQKIIRTGQYAVENGCNNLKMNGIRLLSAIFSNYENQQLSILNEILDLAVKCSNHEGLMPFPIRTSSKNISIFCALVMTLLQSTAILPGVQQFNSPKSNLGLSESVEPLNLENMETITCKRYRNVQLYSQHLTYEFLRSCLNQNDQCGSRFNYFQRAFTGFIHDLLDVLMEPEWPVSHTLLFDIAKHLVTVLQNKNLKAKVQILCMGWLSEIMVKIKQCFQLAEKNNENINKIIINAHKNVKSNKDDVSSFTLNEGTRFQDLQSIFLKCVIGKIRARPSDVCVENFYLSMWYCELIKPGKFSTEKSSNNKDKCLSDENKENEPPIKTKRKSSKNSKKRSHKKSAKKIQKEYLLELARTTSSFMNSLHHFDDTTLFLNNSDVKLILSFFVRNGDFSLHFDTLLVTILNMLQFEQPSVRAKSMQCLKLLMDADITLAENPLIQSVMQNCLTDSCITVREISVDLIGKCVSHSPDKREHYYQLIIPHLLDKGVSVRKQVLKILREVTTFYPNLERLSEVYLKILERIEDPSMKSMVIETLNNKWFVPSNSSDDMTNQIKDLNRVVKSAGQTGLLCLKVLVKELFNSNENTRNCKQFVKCLVHYLLKHEVNNAIHDLCDCLKIFNIIAQIKPKILVTYISAIQPYLSLHHQEEENIILSVTGILKQTMPLYENPSESFLAKLEEDLIKLLFVQKHSIVESSVPCLTVIVMKITHNDKIIYDCFNLLFGSMRKFSQNEFFFSNQSLSPVSYIQRCLLIVGLFLKYYDFSSLNAQEYFEESTIGNVFKTFMILLKHPDFDIQWYTLKALGEMCCQYPDYLLNHDLKVIYCDILSSQNIQVEMKQQVLKNIKCFLQEDLQKRTKIENSRRRVENISFQELNALRAEDESSNMKIIVIQQYLKEIIKCCIFQNQNIRLTAAIILKIIILCGLIPPQKVMAHLIALTTDNDFGISLQSYNLLRQVDRSHPGIFDFCIKVGINLSYELQTVLQKMELVRGYEDTEAPSHALLKHLYEIVQRNKLRRRNFLRCIMQLYEGTEVDKNKLLYLSDNLAYLPYELEDELLFVIQFINVIAATTGYDYIKKFQEQVFSDKSQSQILQENNLKNDDEYSENEDNETLFDQLPLDTSILQKHVYSFQSCLLLLKVKQYLQQTYGITNRMIALYSSEHDREPLQLQIDNHCKLISDSHLEILRAMKAKRTLSNEQLIDQYLELKNLVLFERDPHSKKRQLGDRNAKRKEKQVKKSKKIERNMSKKTRK